MKKILLSLLMIFFIGTSVSCADTYAHDDSVLPAAAKSVIKKNFKSGVSLVKIDKSFGRVDEYEVILADGSEITFDSKGNWKDVETSADKSVPSAFIPKGVADFVAKNHKGARIVGIDKGKREYEVTLSNGIEMKFTLDGKFKKYDD